MDQPRGVVIVAPAGASLGVALVAALSARGWDSTLVAEFPRAMAAVGQAILLVAEDDHGRMGLLVPPHVPLRGVVALGSAQSLPVLIPLARRGVRVLNQAAPFVSMLRLLEEALSDDRGGPLAGQRVEMLTRRAAESAALSRLTDAELDALHGLLDGFSAAQMARRTHRSLHTIRSHIKAVLAKLDVTSQVAAVAIAHRSGPSHWPDGWLEQITIFSDEEEAAFPPS